MKLYKAFLYIVLLNVIAVDCMDISVQLDDGSRHALTPYEIESSSLLLQKKLLREKTTSEHIGKWGYEKELYEQLKESPLYLKGIDVELFNFFRQTLQIQPTQFPQYFNKLTEKEKNELYHIASEKQLGVPYLIAQLSANTLLPEIVTSRIAPYFLTKAIINHMRNNIIIDNAKNNAFIQKIEPLSGDDVELRFNPKIDQFMMLPTSLIKKNRYIFDGCVGRVTIKLENQIWTRLIEYKRNDGIRYIITPDITDEMCAQQEVKRFSQNKRIVWTFDDTNKKVLHKKLIECSGGFKDIKFSLNGNYLARSAWSLFRTETCPNNIFVLTTLSQNDKDNYSEVILPIDKKITVFCFNPQSTVLAAGSCGIQQDKTITLWDTQTGSLLSTLTGHANIVNIIQFNHSGTRMLSAAYAGHNNMNIISLNIILWDTTNSANIKTIIKHFLMSPDIIESCHFSPDDTIIVIRVTDGSLLIFDGKTGMHIAQLTHEFSKPFFSSVFSRNGKFFVSTLLGETEKHENNTLLYDVQNGTVLTKLVESQLNICGVGFSPDKRNIILVSSTGQPEGHQLITTTLFDEEIQNAFIWLKKESSLVQKYALYRAYMAQQEDVKTANFSKDFLLRMIDGTTDRDKKVKKIIEQYLI